MKKIPRPVFILGLVSFFNDVASEMIYPMVPIFLTSVLHAPVSAVGFIEGVAEATASFGKFIFGYISDKMQKRKIFVVAGYTLSTISKLLIGLSYFWQFVLFARFIDRLGKGIRTSARDSMLLQNTNKTNKGLIFGFHRSLDSAGAVLGPVAALVLLYFFKDNLRQVFFLAFIPASLGVLLLVLFVKERKTESGLDLKEIKGLTPAQTFHFSWRNLNPSFKLFFFVSILFALGNSSDAFLILRAKSLGLATNLVVVTYILYNLSQAVFATPAGKLADKIGKRKVFAGGLLTFAAVYFLFGIIKNSFWVWIIFPIYGLYIAATDGVSKAYISEFITERESGTYFGLYQTGISICSFFASFFAGFLWHRLNPSATFFYGSLMALLAFFVLFCGKLVKKL